MRLRSQIANRVLPGFVLAAGLVQSGCTHGPRHTFTTMWDRGRSVGQATARMLPFGRRGNESAEVGAAVAEAARPEIRPEPTRTVVFEVENDPFLAESLQAANAAQPLPDSVANTTPRPGNPFASISSTDTDSRVARLVPDPNLAASDGQAGDSAVSKVSVTDDGQFASGFDTQLNRLRRTIRRDLNSASRQNADQPDERVTRNRVNALLQQARGQSQQGDIAAARQSATEAEQIASSTGLFFGPDDVRPSDVLRELDSQAQARSTSQSAGAAAERGDLSNLWDTPVNGNEVPAEDEEYFPMLEPALSAARQSADRAGTELGAGETNGSSPEPSFRPASDFLQDSASADPASSGGGGQVTGNAAPFPNSGQPGTQAAATPRSTPKDAFVWQAEEAEGGNKRGADMLPFPSAAGTRPAAVLPSLSLSPAGSHEEPAAPALTLPAAPRIAANPGTQIASAAGGGTPDRFGWQTVESRKRTPAEEAPSPPHLGWAPVEPVPVRREVKPAVVRPRSRAMQRLTENLQDEGPALLPSGTDRTTSDDFAAGAAVAVSAAAGATAESTTDPQTGQSPRLTFPDQEQPFVPSASESDNEAMVLDGEPLPEIFDTEPVDATVAVRPEADVETGDGRRKSALPSKLVISVLLGLVAMALAWHRFRRMRVGMRPVR